MLSNFKFKPSFPLASSSLKPFSSIINNNLRTRSFSTKSKSSLQPPDFPRLAETARISLPLMRFGQLQAVDLENVEPALRADTEGDNLHEDVPETFENKEALTASVPSYEEPYIKVPKLLNKE